jgi:hypothetical protein
MFIFILFSIKQQRKIVFKNSIHIYYKYKGRKVRHGTTTRPYFTSQIFLIVNQFLPNKVKSTQKSFNFRQKYNIRPVGTTKDGILKQKCTFCRTPLDKAVRRRF